MLFGSVCSGIEAASIAWNPLGWEAAWFAEVDKAASQVLAYRFPAVPNHGDMTLLAEKVRRREILAPDILVGGTPCQAFSVAGLRGGLQDERGQLTLAFVLLADAIDEIRAEDGLPPVIIVWENVPGVLNHADNPFGCFLAGIAGEVDPLQPPGGRWTNAGVVCGPERAVAWRTLDAQYVGLAQRRRRVFVVASAREGFDPGDVLLEFDGVRRDSPPRREAREDATHPVAPCLTSSDRGVERTGDPRGQDAVVGVLRVRPTAGGVSWPAEIACTLNAAFGQKLGLEDQHVNGGCPLFVPHPIACYGFTTKDHGQDASVGIAPTLRAMQGDHPNGGGQVGVAYSVSLRGREGGGTAELGDDVAACLRASTGGGDKPHVLAPVAVLPFDTTQVTSPSSYSSPDYGDPCHPLAAGAHPPAVCVHGTQDPCVSLELAYALQRNSGGENVLYQGEMAVRRLMPVECERLQGFPDDWTKVPVKRVTKRGKTGEYVEIDGDLWQLAADGPRYKQCGNSMATNVMKWIGQRIAAQLPAFGHNGNDFDALL